MVASMFMTALATAAIPVGANAQQRGPAVSVGSNDLGGVVRSAEGPEAGVWVIAETTDTPTRYAKIVVTDDRGRYLIPDLPKAITRSGSAGTDSLIPQKFRRASVRLLT